MEGGTVADSFAFPADRRLCSALYRKDAAFFIDDGGSVCHGVYDGGIAVEVKRSVLTVLYGCSGIFFYIQCSVCLKGSGVADTDPVLFYGQGISCCKGYASCIADTVRCTLCDV